MSDLVRPKPPTDGAAYFSAQHCSGSDQAGQGRERLPTKYGTLCPDFVLEIETLPEPSSPVSIMSVFCPENLKYFPFEISSPPPGTQQLHSDIVQRTGLTETGD